ncbi:MAG TPA: type II secretion system F family protein [Mycobacteriales bacterium]|nr:type II secretion system F family protein [Mycobacteriales bacterium]
MAGIALLTVGLAGMFAAIVVLLATIGVLTSERQAVGRSLAAVTALHNVSAATRAEALPPFSERIVVPALARLTGFGRRLTPTGQVDRLRRKLDHAGNPARWDVDRVLAVKMLGLLGLGVVGLVAAALRGSSPVQVIAFGAVGAGVGYYAPNVWLYQLAATRADRVRKELPDALDLLTISVEAGLGFDAALAQVARHTTGPLAEEFFRVLQEMQIGSSRRDAFKALSERTSVTDLRTFTLSMIQADGFGIPIANVLRVQAKEMRIKRTQRAEEKAQKVPVKILFPLIFCILPALFVIVIGPAGISIFRNIRF